jgi:hypothetical protein
VTKGRKRTVELEVLMVPSKNVLGQDRWWRNAHNDREVWQRRVRLAVEGAGLDISKRWRIHKLVIDWGRRKPTLREDGMDRVRVVMGEGLLLGGVRLAGTMGEIAVEQHWSGSGYGTTTLVLEMEGDDGRPQADQQGDAPVHSGQ